MEKAKFIKRIWELEGKPTNKKGSPDVNFLQEQIGLNWRNILEHFALLEAPKEVKKAVEKGKLAMRSATEHSLY